jgi:hypothetical protein
MEVGPKTLDELLALVPGLRKLRSINCDLLRKLLDRAKGQCTGCGQQVPKGRRTWCSTACETDTLTRTMVQKAVAAVMKRDRGICSICGRDIQKCHRIWQHFYADCRYADRCDPEVVAAQSILGYARGQWHEVDHTVPVVEGGGLCTIDQLRLVCGDCHLAETNRLAARRRTRKA